MLKNYIYFRQGFVVFHILVFSADSTADTPLHNNETYHGQSAGESSLSRVAKIVGSSLSALLCLSGVLWLAFRYRRKSR